MKRLFKSERHYALSQEFPSDLLSSGAMQAPEPRRGKPSRLWRYLAVIAAAAGVALCRQFNT